MVRNERRKAGRDKARRRQAGGCVNEFTRAGARERHST